MKKLAIIFYLFFSVAQAQQNCNPNNVLTPTEFNNKYSQLSKQQGDRYKLDFCKQLMEHKCFTSMQVKQFAMLFNNENNRLQFASEAFHHTIDPQNFYEVYDAFKNFSTAFKLHDLIYGVSIPAGPPVINQNPFPPGMNFPSCDNYKGPKGCPLPIADKDFEFLSTGFANQPDDVSRAQFAIKLINSNCISMAQLMRLCLGFEMESNRLNFLKEAFLKIYDQGNYSYAAVVFTHVPYKNDWISYAESKLMPPPPPPPPVVCTVTPAELDQIKSSINKESSASVKITITKQILSAKKCFTCNQVKEIVNLMSFESGKLEIAKYAYDFTIDKENYYTVADVFSFSSSKEELMKFIKSKN